MSTRCARAILFPLFMWLAGCVSFPIAESEPYQASTDKAVVLVGVLGTEMITVFNVQDGGTPHRLKPPAISGVYAYAYPLGKTFQIKRVVAEANRAGIAYRDANLTNAPALTPDKAGIYYYGTILSRDNRVLVNDKQYPELLKQARGKYKNVFAQLEPVNFK